MWEFIKVWFGLADPNSINTSVSIHNFTGEDAAEKLTKIKDGVLVVS